MQEKTKNRDWVKNAAIIFLAVLLVLTFFSNTIMNRSLPEVATQDVTDGSIVARVRGTGKVTANSNAQVKMEKTRVIRSVLVKVGQQVEAGDVLFTLGEGSSEDIDAAEDKVRQLQTSYNRTAATMPNYRYGADRNRLDHLYEDYQDALIAEQAAYEAAKLAAPNTEQRDRAEEALAAAERAKAAAMEVYSEAMNNAVSLETESDPTRTLDDLLTRQKNIIEHLYNNEMPYQIFNFSYGEYKETDENGKKIYSGKNLIQKTNYDDYGKGEGYLSGQEAIQREITFVQHRINELTSPVTGEDNNQITETPLFTVTWKNDDGTIIGQDSVRQGDTPGHDDPEKASPVTGMEYTFEGWSPNVGPIYSDTVYQAVFSETPINYAITWLNDDGSEIDTTYVNYGDLPEHSDPYKESDDTTIYTFEGWHPSIVPATSDAEYQAKFSEESVIVENNDETINDPEGNKESLNVLSPNTENTLLGDSTLPDAKGAEKPDNETINPGGNVYIDNNGGTIVINPTPTSGDGSTGDDKTGDDDTGGTDTESSSKSYEELDYRKTQLVMLQSAYEDFVNLQGSIDLILNNTSIINARTAYDAAVLEVEKWKTAIDVLAASGNTPQSEAYKTAKANRELAEELYLSAKQALDEKIETNQQTITGKNIDLADTWQQLEKAKRQLADLTGDEEAQILARVAGTIQSISAAPGDTKKKDDVLAVIEAPDMGYNLSFSVTNDQAARLRVGDTATVSNFYWGAEITATLASIQIDQKNPQTNKLLTFDLSGNVTAGTDLTLSVGQKSANYDIIIPSSAIRTDTNGTFVLKVESKNSPLGNRYIARRVPVEVLASDDTNSAVSADLGYGDYVITTSSAPLKNGQLVRLAST